MNNDIVFSLDIGTRSVVGVVAKKIENSLKVIDIKTVFHEQRAMVDGQIEDIKKVSRVIQKVKEELEANQDFKLDDVYIAAAGRSLKTEKTLYEKKIDSKKHISDELRSQVEMEALQKSHDAFYENYKDGKGFYCVGYSVLEYKLDDTNIANIVGHRADKIGIEIIAAFLPHIVVEGLYACMDQNKLNVAGLTLEPIAAMNLIIPKDLRLLNLALVDIGAGTSDIAVSKNGSIIGYDMATVAGDEISESIMKNYIVDFNTAEKIKLSLLGDNPMIEFTDILGMTVSLDKNDVITAIDDAIINLCREICEKIIKLNKESPVAVFLIGGGSKTPRMKKYISEILGLPEFRIAIGTKDSIKNIDTSSLSGFDPELITPIGIAYSSIAGNNYDFFSVTVNGEKVRLYSIRQMKVMDSLLMSGFDSRRLMGFSGRNLNFTLNNKDYYYKGEYSTPAQIFVNSNIANIETRINPGDVIEVIPAVDGVTPIVKISDIVDNMDNTDNMDNMYTANTCGKVFFNNIEINLGTKYLLNNVEVDQDYIIGNSDVIEIINVNRLFNLIELYEIDAEYYSFYSGGVKIDLDTVLVDGMRIALVQNDLVGFMDNLDNSQSEQDSQSIENTIVTETIAEVNTVEINTTEVNNLDDKIYVNLNDEIIELKEREDKTPYIFADMLTYTDIDPSNPQGDLIILHNGDGASYTGIINDGDTITIKWGN
jgi:cell division protein FtsA